MDFEHKCFVNTKPKLTKIPLYIVERVISWEWVRVDSNHECERKRIYNPYIYRFLLHASYFGKIFGT